MSEQERDGQMGATSPTTSDQKSDSISSSKTESRLESGPKLISAGAKSLFAELEQRRKRDRQSIESEGGPAAWLQRRAPELLPLFPAGPVSEAFYGETVGGWLDAAERVKECGRCPPEGGACASRGNAWTEGHVMVKTKEGGIGMEFCPKWPTYATGRLLASANVPLPLRRPRPIESLPGYKEKIAPVCDEAMRSKKSAWFFVTGGDARAHRYALVTLAYVLGSLVYNRSFWYDWSERVAVGLREHMNDSDTALDLRYKLRSVHVLAIDHVNPTGWKDWFREAIDEILAERSDRPTIIASSKSVEELTVLLPVSAPLLENAVEVNLS